MLSFDWSIFWTIFNLLVLLLLLKKFLFKPITKMMESRTKEIEDSLKDAEAKAMQTQYEEQLKTAQVQAARIVSDAKGRAEAEYDKILKTARADAQKAAEQAKGQIALEREKMLGDVKDNMAEIILLTAAKLSEKELDRETDRKFVSSFLQEVEAKR